MNQPTNSLKLIQYYYPSNYTNQTQQPTNPVTPSIFKLNSIELISTVEVVQIRHWWGRTTLVREEKEWEGETPRLTGPLEIK